MLFKKPEYQKKYATTIGFSLIEVMVTLAIISIVLAISVSKYGSFNNVVLLKNQAFEIALDIRQAQTYASSVRVEDTFKENEATTTNPLNLREEVGIRIQRNGQYTIFVDQNQARDRVRLSTSDNTLKTNTIDDRFEIYEICTPSGGSEMCGVTQVDISFARPDFDALILIDGTNMPQEEVNIRLRSRNNNAFARSIKVTAAGQISVENVNI